MSKKIIKDDKASSENTLLLKEQNLKAITKYVLIKWGESLSIFAKIKNTLKKTKEEKSSVNESPAEGHLLNYLKRRFFELMINQRNDSRTFFGKSVKKSKYFFIFILFIVSINAKAQFIQELNVIVEANVSGEAFCKGGKFLENNTMLEIHPEYWIAKADIYNECSKDAPAVKLLKSYELYSKATKMETRTEHHIKNWSNHGRMWAYQRLADLLYFADYETKIPGYNYSDYGNEVLILYAAAAVWNDAGKRHGFRGPICSFARDASVWLHGNSCQSFVHVAYDYFYRKGQKDFKSSLKNSTQSAMMWMYHVSVETNNDPDNVKLFYSMAKDLTNKSGHNFEGSWICIGDSIHFERSILAFRTDTVKDSQYGKCTPQKWKSGNEKFSYAGIGKWGVAALVLDKNGLPKKPNVYKIIDMPPMRKLASDMGNELMQVNVSDINIMNDLVDKLGKRLSAKLNK